METEIAALNIEENQNDEWKYDEQYKKFVRVEKYKGIVYGETDAADRLFYMNAPVTKALFNQSLEQVFEDVTLGKTHSHGMVALHAYVREHPTVDTFKMIINHQMYNQYQHALNAVVVNLEKLMRMICTPGRTDIDTSHPAEVYQNAEFIKLDTRHDSSLKSLKIFEWENNQADESSYAINGAYLMNLWLPFSSGHPLAEVSAINFNDHSSPFQPVLADDCVYMRRELPKNGEDSWKKVILEDDENSYIIGPLLRRRMMGRFKPRLWNCFYLQFSLDYGTFSQEESLAISNILMKKDPITGIMNLELARDPFLVAVYSLYETAIEAILSTKKQSLKKLYWEEINRHKKMQKIVITHDDYDGMKTTSDR